jgi:hypothetical protein
MSSTASHRLWIGLLICSAAISAATFVGGDEPRESRQKLKEPVFRITKRIEPAERQAAHPLDPAIEMATQGLIRIRESVNDYTCLIIKQERINGTLLPTEKMHAEIRNGKVVDGKVTQDFGVYLRFLKPDAVAGREVIHVANQNKGKMVAHEAKGFRKAFGWVWLKPEGIIAMQGQRYPITEIGIENLIAQLIDRGTRDKKNDPQGKFTTVRFIEGAKINNRVCTVLEVMHPEKKPWFDFYIARIFIDDELQLPVRYAAYSWPTTPGGQPVVEEAYTYLNMNINVGLQDAAFDHTKK